MTQRTLALVVAVVPMLAFRCFPQSTAAYESRENAAELIARITHQSQRTGAGDLPPDMSGCGQYRREREWANLLAGLGASAVPDLDRALDSIQTLGGQSPFAFHGGWLAYAYAKIRGPAAHQRLLLALASPNCSSIRDDISGAIALSLDLTSFVARSDVQIGWLQCGRMEEPRDTLNHLILACERGDRRLLESTLGPSARNGISALLSGSDWVETGAQTMRGDPGSPLAVGYRLEVPGRWSEPAENLEEGRSYGPEIESAAPEIEARFKDIAGDDCGRYRIKFLKAGTKLTETPRYLVDNSDLGGLLRIIAACAAHPARRR